jgi:mortality factor 4-like protein 1
MAKFAQGDMVLARQGPLFYKAKVIKVKNASAEPYQVHFDGWKKRYDMWVTVDALMAMSPENLLAMEDHNAKAKVEEKRRKDQKKRAAYQQTQLRAMQKKAKLLAEGADFAHLREENKGQVKIPFTLKKRLMQDWERLQEPSQSKEPTPASVSEIMTKFVEEEETRLRAIAKGKNTKCQSCGAELLLCREWADGLTFYFDAVLENLLLVRFTYKICIEKD